MRVTYKPEDQEVIDSFHRMIELRVDELLKYPFLLEEDVAIMENLINIDPYLNILQEDLLSFIQSRPYTMFDL